MNCKLLRAESREQRAESREQRAQSREQRAQSREHRAGSTEQGAWSRLQVEGPSELLNTKAAGKRLKTAHCILMIWSPFLCPLYGLFKAPLFNILFMSAQQYFRYFHAFKICGAGVNRRAYQSILKGIRKGTALIG